MISTGLELSELEYTSVLVEGVAEHATALEDGGAEVGMVDTLTYVSLVRL